MIRTKQAELLAPAGSYESMTAAVCAGADAVYLGGQLFGARAYADNLDTEQLKQAIDYVHLHKKSLYLTVNTLLKEEELQEKLYDYIKPLYEQGLDAVIVQDMGVFSFIREQFPALPIHASTQMTLTGVHGAAMLKELGAQRIVTARELSLKEIADIHQQVDIEIESFVHGALCYCYSGQCLFSSIAGGRSGNRGRCAQPCRLPYSSNGKQQYYLSPKDLCTVSLLPELIEAGIYSLKIEGRMKKPEYTAGVVSIYRKYLDEYLSHGTGYRYQVKNNDAKILFDIYNRGGFTEGYYKKYNGIDMMFLQGREGEAPDRNDALFEHIRKTYMKTEKKELITGTVTVFTGQPSLLTVHLDDVTVQVSGDEAMPAQKQPLTGEKIRRQLEKLGNTPFTWERLDIFTDEQSFLPVTALNELRRAAIEKLIVEYLQPYRRQTAPSMDSGVEKTTTHRHYQRDNDHDTSYHSRLNVYLEKVEYLKEILTLEGVDAIYLDSCVYDIPELKAAVQENASCHKELFYVLPHIFRKKEEAWLNNIYETLMNIGIQGFVVKNYEEMEYLKKKCCPLAVRCDYTVYMYNRTAKEALQNYLAFQLSALPVELNEKELRNLSDSSSEMIVYGRIPMMISAQCVCRNTKGCRKEPELLTITDRYRNEFPVKNQCKFCYNRIYNCKPLSFLTRAKDIAGLAPGAVRLDFTTESVEEAVEITRSFINAYKKGISYTEEPWDFTRGHFKRGIE